MKIVLFTVFSMALLGGCGEQVSSPASEANLPEFERPVAARKPAVAFVPKRVVAPVDAPVGHSEPDFKDSAGNLDSSR